MATIFFIGQNFCHTSTGAELSGEKLFVKYHLLVSPSQINEILKLPRWPSCFLPGEFQI